MAVVTYTMEQYKALIDSIAQGVLTVTYGNGGGQKSVTYRSLNEMLRLKEIMEVALGLKDQTGARLYASHSKGLC